MWIFDPEMSIYSSICCPVEMDWTVTHSRNTFWFECQLHNKQQAPKWAMMRAFE